MPEQEPEPEPEHIVMAPAAAAKSPPILLVVVPLARIRLPEPALEPTHEVLKYITPVPWAVDDPVTRATVPATASWVLPDDRERLPE